MNRIVICFMMIIGIWTLGDDRGAYLSVPNPDLFQFRTGQNLGYVGGLYDDAKMTNLSALAGCDTQRKKLPEAHFEKWGYEIEKGDSEFCYKVGMNDLVGYLSTPSSAHSAAPSSQNAEMWPPSNLYEPIWLDEEKKILNKNNHWANYVFKSVTIYKKWVRIWEVWNEPDYTNWQNVKGWETNPPTKDQLSHWNGSIFEYIRLLRISYEVIKHVDPSAWVAVGGLGYWQFLDAIFRYTDNPEGGIIADKYPAYGGAWFDVLSYHQYPIFGVEDLETKEKINENGSDSFAKKFVTLGKSHRYLSETKYGFDGKKYPKKIVISTETGVGSRTVNGQLGGEVLRRNYILKMPLLSLEYDIKQVHFFVGSDSKEAKTVYDTMGDYEWIDKDKDEAKIKESTKARLVLKKFNINKMMFNKEKTEVLRKSLGEKFTGTVLTERFKRENETEWYEMVYALWAKCNNTEITGIELFSLDLPSEALMVEWNGNSKKVGKKDTISLDGTPVFFLFETSSVFRSISLMLNAVILALL